MSQLQIAAPDVGPMAGDVVAAIAKTTRQSVCADFSEQQWRELRAQDKLAGTAIVAVMTTIFLLGLLGYTVIALICAGG